MPASHSSASSPALSYEEALTELERLVSTMETGQVPLEQLIGWLPLFSELFVSISLFSWSVV
jgi:hypothetical protein